MAALLVAFVVPIRSARALPATSAPAFYVAETGHNLSGQFKAFYERNGGAAIFGWPLTEVIAVGDLRVQYFERACFEYHPELAGAEVQISPLGRDYVQHAGVPTELLAPAPPIVQLGAAAIAIPASAQHNVGLAARQINGAEVTPGAVLSFLNTVGEISPKRGYAMGQAIVDGVVGSSVGGGICYVSTALYRAAFLAGLDIIERRPHSLILASFSDTPGFDAAVDTRGPDLRWRNDTPHPIFISAELRGGTLMIALWGQGDGRTTTMRGPTIQRGPAGLRATISRVVIAANGTALRKETVQSIYLTSTHNSAHIIRPTAKTPRAPRIDP